jgi:hypothetical protein
MDQDIIYPFVSLADHAPVFPSGSSPGKNVGEILNRVVFKRHSSHEFLYIGGHVLYIFSGKFY